MIMTADATHSRPFLGLTAFLSIGMCDIHLLIVAFPAGTPQSFKKLEGQPIVLQGQYGGGGQTQAAAAGRRKGRADGRTGKGMPTT